jgi:hypothetical protein
LTRWPKRWLQSTAERQASLWRAVEAQHVISTMRLTDTAAEQALLERLLETSKPPLPADAVALPYLLATPFRYVSRWPSRFRPASEPGIWYGAAAITTACAEVGYWRWRFLIDSEGLRDQATLVEFTVFQARVKGSSIDLTSDPWRAARALWMDPSDYRACHELAAAARERAVQWIRYASVRHPDHGSCGAVLAPQALLLPRTTLQQTWAARIRVDSVTFSHDGEVIEFSAAMWS